jgi:hypothetical protein
MSRIFWLILLLAVVIWLGGIVFNVMGAAMDSLFILAATVLGAKLFSPGGRKI